MEDDRRVSVRARLVKPLWLNKFIEGHPYLAELIDLSEEGLLIRTIREPLNQEDSFPLELGVPGTPHRMWLWARSVRRVGATQAVQISYADMLERAQLRQLVRWNVAA
jgi:hypothetical protein